ncbi:MAG: rubredoxin [Firmicutes bacterium GWF2_51_9]|nr:MAG: rubredoxin [Firmicutes bacterium GWF2_51_9]OGS59238.1 MAG: rubredoxin [Firmicutes bacterium GWE2_51_13]HAM62282.1 rubredoxin [Erysipelotrichaceae bacterium]HAO61231.1 rubredoxin [Erysipelotrichaceae bacterium]HBZ41803.1 rubredoxin [Erysipelotrichaceae bacterium]
MKKLYRCEVCGIILEEDQLEDHCPKCNAPREKFSEVSAETAEKITRSEFTNDLHADLIHLCVKLEKLAEAGIADNLDPSCVKIFTRTKKYAKLLKQLAKAEIQGHISKEKW